MASTYTFTSESVTEGHPDKVADQISDAVLDAVLAADPRGRVACETLVTTGLVVIAGEISTTATPNYPAIARDTLRSIGYGHPDAHFDGNTCAVVVAVDEQSPDIRMGLSDSLEARSGADDALSSQGAGDQGLMFGYATDETPDLMPMPIWLAHRLAKRLAYVRKEGLLEYLRPDGKTQVSIRYESGKPVAIDTIVVSCHHRAGVDYDKILKPDIVEAVVKPVLPPELLSDDMRVLVNPTGAFVIGGPVADTGLTGRKIIVDTYGGMARHGGGALSGKDASKVDRSAAYAARWIAKHVVASGAAAKCEVQVAYAIGVAKPVSLMVETFGTEIADPAKIGTAINELFDLRPAAIIADLDLLRPQFTQTAAYGHFGRDDLGVMWEKTPKADALRSFLGLGVG